MSLGEIATVVVAAVALIGLVATGSKYYLDRVQIEVTSRIEDRVLSRELDTGRATNTLAAVVIRAKNVGRRAVTISDVGVQLEDGSFESIGHGVDEVLPLQSASRTAYDERLVAMTARRGYAIDGRGKRHLEEQGRVPR